MFLIVYAIIISSKRLCMSSVKSPTHRAYDLPILFDINYCSRSIVIKDF